MAAAVRGLEVDLVVKLEGMEAAVMEEGLAVDLAVGLAVREVVEKAEDRRWTWWGRRWRKEAEEVKNSI